MKKSTTSKIVALLLACLMLVSVFAGCKKTDEVSNTDISNTDAGEPKTLVVGYSNFSEKFSPFFAESAYDQDVASMTHLGLLGTDREGNVVLKGIEGEVIPYNGTDYTYKGIADCDIVEKADGTVDYNITMKEGVVFSDGTPMTIDDAIFSLYVFCDPTYNGSSTMYAMPIKGVDEYRSGMISVAELCLADIANGDGANVQAGYVTQAQVDAYKEAINKGGEAFAQDIADYCMTNYADYGAVDVATSAALWGFELPEGATAADFFAAILEAYGYDLSDGGINAEKASLSIGECIAAALGDKASEYDAGVQTGESAPNIEGIKKTGDYSMTVTLTKVDATAIYNMGWTVAPLHYYGDKAKYDYNNNKFGFTKGDLSSVRNVTTKPMGAGAYKFVSYENGVVTFEANENYYNGKPKTQTILFKEVNDADKLTGVATGTLDVSDPSISDAAVKSIKEYNGNDSVCGPVIETNTVDNLGYGYIGICSKRVNVGGVIDSDASKNLRKAFATLFGVYRDTVINSYYGERASVIQYPISNTSWAAPKPADEGYKVAFSTGVDGKQLYTATMTDDEKFAVALDAAVEYLKAAGYTWDDAQKKFTAAPEGASMTYEFMIPADGTGDHPTFGVITAAAAQLKTVGIDLQINDLSDSSVLWDALAANTCDMWAAAWGATVDPDMYQIYHSSNVAGVEGSSESNHYCIMDSKLDELIMAGRSSLDKAYRKATYKQCLDTILDWACEIPVYQRQNAIIFSAERVNLDTVTPDITTFWGWMNDIELLEMN